MKKTSKHFTNIICIISIICMLTLASCAGRQEQTALPAPVSTPQDTAPATVSYELSGTFDGRMPEVSLMPLRSAELAVTQTASGNLSDISLSIPAKFNITRPSEKLTTTYDKYFITGTSNPDSPVYMGNAEIERLGTKGTFGVLVDLKMGDNAFTFRQGGESKTVTITRKSYIPSASIPISDITQSSMVPAVFAGAKAGGTMEVGCIAPSGASVTAAFGGKSVALRQVAETQKSGVPAFFKGSIEIGGGYDDDVTQNAGKVTYKMSYNGKSKEYTSTGDVYVAGRNSHVAVRVKSYMGFVYPNVNTLSQFKEKLKAGAADYLKSQDNTYAEISSGGFIPKEQLEVLEGRISLGNKFSKVRASSGSKSETYTFTGTNSPAYATKLADGEFKVTFYNTTGAPDADISGSKLFSGVSVSIGESSVIYTFTQKNNSLWGYNVSYDGKNTILTFNYRPKLASGSRPLEGITVVLDPGHGGTDRGALGVANTTGPSESDLNLAHAYATRDLLASMGAKVRLTRSEDIYFSLDDRLKYLEDTKADFFISLHHNSIGENVDANKIKGVEVYYHTGMSKKLANNMFSSVTGLGRSARFVNQSYYRVTLSPYSPSVLVELGFLSNPLEYERAASQSQINNVAQAVADAMVGALS